MRDYKQSSKSGLWLPSRRDLIKVAVAGAAAALPKPAHAVSNWTYRRSVQGPLNGGRDGTFSVKTDDANLAVACLMYANSPPWVCVVRENGVDFDFASVGSIEFSYYSLFLEYRVLTNQSTSETFSWHHDGGEFSLTMMLFAATGTPVVSGTAVESSGATTPNQTTLANDTLVIATLGGVGGSSQPSGIGSGFTAALGSAAGGYSNSSIAYKIEPSSGASNSPVWTQGGGAFGTQGMMFAIAGAATPKIRHRSGGN